MLWQAPLHTLQSIRSVQYNACTCTHHVLFHECVDIVYMYNVHDVHVYVCACVYVIQICSLTDLLSPLGEYNTCIIYIHTEHSSREQSVVGSNPTLAAHFSLQKRVVSVVVIVCFITLLCCLVVIRYMYRSTHKRVNSYVQLMLWKGYMYMLSCVNCRYWGICFSR